MLKNRLSHVSKKPVCLPPMAGQAAGGRIKMKKESLTLFEWKVLKAALQIPLGQTRSYRWVAQKIGRPKAIRAVGQALHKNPYPLIIPCHRVINKDGSLGGYSGGLKLKACVLRLEKEIAKNLKDVKIKL